MNYKINKTSFCELTTLLEAIFVGKIDIFYTLLGFMPGQAVGSCF